MECGVSTACFYPMETSESLATLLAEDFTLFEIFFNTESELEMPYLARLKGLLDGHGARVRSVHPFTCGYEGVMLFSNYAPRFDDGLRFYERYFAAARFLGAGLLILHGMPSQFRSEQTEARYFDRYRTLYRLGQEYGVTVAQENVAGYFGEDPSFIRRMREALGEECGFCFDVKQAVRAGVDWGDMLDAMGGRLRHIHLNDNRPGESCLLPGAGAMDLEGFFRTLHAMGYAGDVVIEVYRRDFQTAKALRQSRILVENWMKNAEKATKI